MKILKLLLAMCATTFTILSCGSKKAESQKILVLYYSQNGTTEKVAQEIAGKLNADIEAICSANPYDGDFGQTIERCNKEREAGIVPENLPLKLNPADYDVIFLGYPVWFGTYAPPVAYFLNNTDLSGKKIVPFCTFGSGGIDSSTKDIIAIQPNAEVLPGYGVRTARIDAMPKEVDQFLKAGGFIEGEYVKLADFPQEHEATGEEAAIFDAAVAGYPMINARAKAVSAREVPDGMEYLFTAENLPRDPNAENLPPASDIKVYVLVENGHSPVFTQVLR